MTPCPCCKRNTHGRPVCDQCAVFTDHIASLKTFDQYETQALSGAQREAKAYMDTIGKTDLREFDAHEAARLCEVIVKGFGDELRAVAMRGTVPF